MTPTVDRAACRCGAAGRATARAALLALLLCGGCYHPGPKRDLLPAWQATGYEWQTRRLLQGSLLFEEPPRSGEQSVHCRVGVGRLPADARPVAEVAQALFQLDGGAVVRAASVPFERVQWCPPDTEVELRDLGTLPLAAGCNCATLSRGAERLRLGCEYAQDGSLRVVLEHGAEGRATELAVLPLAAGPVPSLLLFVPNDPDRTDRGLFVRFEVAPGLKSATFEQLAALSKQQLWQQVAREFAERPRRSVRDVLHEQWFSGVASELDPRVRLQRAASLLQANITGALALTCSDRRLQRLLELLPALGEAPRATAGWSLDRAAIALVANDPAQTDAERSLWTALFGAMADDHAGLHLASLEAEDRPAFEQALIAGNRTALESPDPAMRLLAYDWLRNRGGEQLPTLPGLRTGGSGR